MTEVLAAEYWPRGTAWTLFESDAAELVVTGPAGTGKTRACLEKLDWCCRHYPGMRAVIVRKTRQSMTQSVLVTWVKKVIAWDDSVTFRTGEQEYRYPNGSVVALSGLDKPSKILSSEYDLVYINQAEEVTENDWELVATRLRHGVMPYQQLLADCNPDHPRHWLKIREGAGRLVMLESRHEDNPILWDGRGWTVLGKAYIEKLDALTGVRRARLRFGRWAAAEGLVYEGWDRAVHLIDPFEIPSDWRVFASVDWGFTNPGVIQVWAVDGDGRMYRIREVYRTRQTIAWWVSRAGGLEEAGSIERWICDPSEPAFIQAFCDDGLWAAKADNDIVPGVQAVQERLKVQGDGKPRLFLFRDALAEGDEALVDAKKPTCTEEEIDCYVWPKGGDGKVVKEVPVKLDDHGLDALRYAVMYVDADVGTGESAMIVPDDIIDERDTGGW